MAAVESLEFTLRLNEEERAELLRLLETCLREVHGERRRTEAPAYQSRVAHEESLIHGLTEKVRHLR
jgi:hypothetical protein